MKFLIGIVVALLIAGGLVFAFSPQQEIEVTSSADHQFTIDESMERVRKVLVRTNAVKKIVAMSDAELKGQKWLDMDFEMPGKLLDRNWHVEGEGKLGVLIKDSYIGDNQITLNQAVDIKRQRLHVTNVLDKPVGAIQDYDSAMTLTPDDIGNAAFESKLELKIKTTANWLTRSKVEKEIKASAKRSLQKQEQAIRAAVSEQDGKMFIIPDKLRGKDADAAEQN